MIGVTKLMTVILVTVGILQIIPEASSDCAGVDPRCVPPTSCEACKRLKCTMALQQKMVKCDTTAISPLIGGNQCCDAKTVARLSGSRRRKRQAYNFDKDPERKWPIPVSYAVDSSFSQQADSMALPYVLSYFRTQTCVSFAPVDVSSTTPHMTFTPGDACTSFVGRTEFDSSAITLTRDCFTSWGQLLYYLCQSMGMFHQSQRTDRDSYISVNFSNVPPSRNADFAILDNANTLVTLGLPYDLASIQQFPPKIYTINEFYTIVTKDPLYQNTIGQRVEMSFQDVKLFNMLYCNTICSASSLPGVCLKGGYQDPNNCSRCKCPDGFAGQFCERYDTTGRSCGGAISASPTEMTITSPGYTTPGYYDSYSQCVWSISAQNGGNISLRFTGYFGIYKDVSEACYHWVEVRYKGKLNETGPRFCGTTLPTAILVSASTEVLLIFRSNISVDNSGLRRGFEIAYKIVNADVCAYVVCQNGGSCANGNCLCPPGITGTMCEIGSTVGPTTSSPPPFSCTPNPCHNNGTCSANGNTVSCKCINGFTGQFCTKGCCGGCNSSPGQLDSKCTIAESPARMCQVVDFVDTTSGLWSICRTRVVTRNVTCTWSVCCDNAADFGCNCGVIGWADWCTCSVSCGGGVQTRRKYGTTRIDLVGSRSYGGIGTEQRSCNTQKCACPAASTGRNNGRKTSCSACKVPSFMESGDQCVPST